MLLTVVAWAIAANVANHLFLAGVQPFELAGASAIIATFGLAVLDSLFGRTHAKPISHQQFALGLILVGLVGADYAKLEIVGADLADRKEFEPTQLSKESGKLAWHQVGRR
ncbi:MAG: hypothetical protein HC827_07095 [Cyanobacteria bacterium RM1_2_2]|nr:hypothetical protein [Cyanobacteria bacterium RM1_2_2]